MIDRAGMRFVRSEQLSTPTFFDLENLHFVDRDGSEVVRSVVRHPGAVVIVPERDGRIVMIRQYRAAVDADVLELPAGKLDVPGEEPSLAAARECEEEIGLRPAHLTRLLSFLNSPGFTDEHTVVFAASEFESVDRTPIGPEEVASEIVEVEVDEVREMILDGRIDDAKSIIGIMAYLHLHDDDR